MITENLSTLKIHKLTQAQYERELEAGRIDPNALYLTPDEAVDLTPYATKDEVASTYETKADASAKLTEAKEYAQEYADTVASGKADANHNHDDAYDAKGAANTALESAKAYADEAANAVKDDLLNGAGAAYDTLKELGDLIVDNKDAIDALEEIAAGKADADHDHAIADVTGLQDALDGKAAAEHGVHVTYSTTAPVMDGTASAGTASTVARSDHRHPTDTSRAAQTDLDALTEVVNGKADATHSHAISEITNLQTTLDGKAASVHTHTLSQISDVTATATELNCVAGVTSNVQEQLDGKADDDHTHDAATESAAGFMSAADKAKLDSIEEGATAIVVDSALSSESSNPVQNRAINAVLVDLASAVSANVQSIQAHTQSISELQTAVSEIQEISSEEIQSLFAN